MNNLEKFGLISGIIGLVADVVGLITFLAGLWHPSMTNSATNGEMPFLIQAIFAFTIVYGWFSIGWVLIRRAFLLRKYSKKAFISATLKTIFAVGIMIFPLVIAWWVVIVKTDESQQRVEIANRKAIEATQAALVIPTPVATVLLTPNAPTNINRDKADASVWYCAMIPTHAVMTLGLFFVVVLIMPTIYPDMPEVTISDLLYF